ncbi:MAG TPA: tripartite tricarboxylate transporter TctB family protein [Casimicrobiaceae bacterium]|nr:tripartite tricarboxylate transporter TctB family protein [Casimicrobiaceae bacterium]
MNDRNLAKGLLLMAIALAFGLQALRYPMGGLGRAGPGLFPLLVSSALFLLGATAVARSRAARRVPIDFNARNIALILASLCGFALLSEHVNMIAGTVFMVFCASLAGTSYSTVRNLKVAAGLIVIALLFEKAFGLQLPLY